MASDGEEGCKEDRSRRACTRSNTFASAAAGGGERRGGTHMARQNSSSSSIPSRSLSASDQILVRRDEKVAKHVLDFSCNLMQSSPWTEQSWEDGSRGEAGEPGWFELSLNKMFT